ncbi:MAG: terminase family protein, partial [Gammaproteobacteria bacterium]|nr:terminase family protein [Gammaproteobacteria bacterium]
MVNNNDMGDIKESLYKLGNGEEPPENMIPLLKEELADEMRRRFLTYEPYPPQLAFHNSTALERVMSGANQSGKSFAGAMEMAFHLTGIYPDWFKGRRLKPRYNNVTGRYELSFWVVGTDNKTVRDVLQKNIVGDMRDGFRGGVLHPDYIIQESMVRSRGVQDLIDTIKIRHESGCDCRLQFRSYEQGRSNLQSATIDLVYCDEEPPEDIIGELRARLTATGGFMFMAFTPLSGMTALVQEFWNSEDQNEKFLVCMSIYESGHMSEEKLKAVEIRYAGLSHAMRQARMYGIPTMGSGMV